MNYNDFEQIKDSNGLTITVRFKGKIEEYDSVIDVGMMADIRTIKEDGNSDCVVFYFDVGKYLIHNRDRMAPTYYDDNSIPCLTAEENGLWPKNGIEKVWFDKDSNLLEYFDVVSVL